MSASILCFTSDVSRTRARLHLSEDSLRPLLRKSRRPSSTWLHMQLPCPLLRSMRSWKPSDSASADGKASRASGRRPRTPLRPPSSSPLEFVPVSARSAKAAPPHESSSSASGSARLIRGDELVSEHAGVQVPVLPLRVKPKPPQKPEMSQATGRIGRFTDEEKIFFIQFLRWRLGRDGPVPTQRKLCRALSREVRCYYRVGI